MVDLVETKSDHEDSAVARSSQPDTTTERPGEEMPYPKGIKLAIMMASLLLGTSLMALDATIISVATPKNKPEFKALGDVGWYGAAYSMILTTATPIAATFYKFFNPKYVHLAFILTFEVSGSMPVWVDHLAWVELRLVLRRLLRTFDLSEELTEKVDFDEFPIVLMMQKGPVKLRINVREGAVAKAGTAAKAKV
ncbi:MAG: hypothetical protein Q9161_002542 [Pseudevernia consocians]